MERECQARNDEGQEKDRQDALSAASEAGGFALADVERLGSAGVSAAADLQGVPPGFDRYVDGLVQFHGPGTLAVDYGVVRAAADFHSNGFVRQLQRCGHLLISSCFGWRFSECSVTDATCRRPSSGSAGHESLAVEHGGHDAPGEQVDGK